MNENKHSQREKSDPDLPAQGATAQRGPLKHDPDNGKRKNEEAENEEEAQRDPKMEKDIKGRSRW